MQQDSLTLDNNRKDQLDSNIKKMLESGASNDDVMSYAGDFKNKFGVKKKDITQPDFQFGSQTSPFGSKPSQTQVDTSVPSVLLTDDQKKQADKERIGKRFETTLLDVPTEFGKVAPAMKAAKKVKDTLPDTPEFRRVGEIQKNKPVEMTEGQRLGESLTKGSDFQEITTDRLTNKKTALQKQLEQAKGAFASVQGEDVAREIDMYIQDPESFRDIETNTWLGNAIRTGLLTGDLANAIPTADYNPSQEAIARAADANYKMGRIPQSEAQIEFQKSGFGVFKDPLLGAQWLTETAASSLAGLYQAAKRTVPLSVGAGATAGAAFFGVGAIPGALLGLQSGLGVAGLNLATSSNIIESLNENGVDITNRKELIKAFSDEEKMSEIRSTALKYGVPIMVLDLATAGIAGKLIGGAAGKSIARKIGAGLGEAGIQATGGMIGELSGQALSGQEIDWNEVAAEGVVSLFTDAPDVAIGAMTRDKSSSSNKNIVAQINKFGADDGSVDAKINLDRDLANGTITPEEYEQGVQFIGKAVVANEKIPIGIEGENREKSIELIAKKDDILLDIEKLNKQKEDVDDSFYPAIDEQIKAKESEIKILNKDIQESAKTPTKPITAQPTQEDVLITPETSSNYANMTEDDKGNFVFFHVGAKGYDKIKPGTGASTVTSREEAAALSKVGGLGMYYTDPNQEERQSAAGAKYAVKIPKEKVYDFNTDKLNFIEEAKARHEAENPGKAFDINSQLAYVTKIAGENGFDMVVAQWNNMTRAQTTKELTPTDIQESEGNVIKKAFNEQYESNKKKGFEPVVPVAKSERLATLYDKINKIRNKEKRYDDLYRLYADSNKLEQDKITELINESDLPQEIKDEYKDILESKEETRRSQQTKPKEDAVQKQTAGQVPVLTEAKVGQEVEQGKPQPKPEVVTEEGKEVVIDKESIVKNSAKELERVKSANRESEDGATFNIDGTKYEGVGLVVPVTSLNTTINKINPQMLADFVEKNKNKIGDMDTVKFGIYKFPNSNQISIDLNIIASEKFKDQAIEFGRLAGQESLFDLETYENVKTGSDGKNPIDFTDTQFKEISKALKDGRIPDVFAGESKDLASKIRSLKINIGSGTAQSNIAGLPIALYNSVVETVALLVEAGSTISDAIDKAIKKYSLDKVEKFNKPELTKNIEKTSKPQKAKSVKDIDVNKIRMQDRPGNRVSKGLAVKTVGGEKIVEESDNLSIKYVKENAPKVFISNAEKLARYPIVSGVKKFGEIKTDQQAQEVYDIFIRQVADNLKYLTNNYNSELREISTLWYDGANILANGLSDQYGISVEQAAGIIAAMSPQKDWYMNVRLAELVMLAYKQDAVLTNEMIAKQVDIAKEGEKPFLKSLKKAKDELLKSRTKENIEKSIDAQNKYTSSKEKAAKVIEWLKGYIGKNIKSVPEEVQPYIIRLHNELNNTKDFNVLRPDGEIIEIAKTKDGENKKIAWGSYSEIGKAASIYNNGSQENITKSLGEMHKIRNFYNNIIDPMSKDGDVTIDTHAVAAALMQPLSGNSKQVGENFGTGTSNSSPLGIKGLYYAYSDAYDLAAKELGLLPRQVQSITWEAVRGLFTDVFKRNIAEVKKINDIWKDYENGKITIEQARTAIDKSAGGVKDPTWAKSVLQEPKDGFEQRSIREGDGVSGPAVIGKSSTVRVAVKSIRKLKIDLGKGTAQSNILGLPIALYNAAIETIALGLEAGLSINDAINKAIEKHKLLNIKAFDKNSFVSKIENATSQPVKLNELFKSNLELSNIGTPEQYSKYLDTIFPDSKVKGIVYHGSKTKKPTQVFVETFIGKNNRVLGAGKGFYFTSDINYSKVYGETTFSIINIKNPTDFNSNNYDSLEDLKKAVKELSNKGDGVIDSRENNYYPQGEEKLKLSSSPDYIVFKPSQIHILGSNQDIEGFRKFVGKQKSQKTINLPELNESKVENAIELLDDIEDNRRKSERASSKRKAELDEKITKAETELYKISDEAQIVKAINDNFDKIKKDLKEQGLLNVKC